MRLEAIGESFTYRWPGGEVRFEPGIPIDLPDERAQRLLNKAGDKVRVIPSTIQPGSTITWQRADDLTMQTGVVDWLHTDDRGLRWAFVTIGDSWAAVNLKFATINKEDIP